MATLTSELIARLRDGISGPAGKAGRSLDALAKKGSHRSFLGRVSAATREATGALIGFGGVAGGALLAKEAFTQGAENSRAMARIGITADATAAQVQEAGETIRKTARETGLGLDDVRAGLDSLTAAGRNMPDALAFLPAVARTAQASGAAVNDMAASADALGANLKVAGKDMQGAFDILVQAGKEGKFELKDMAQFLPSLAAQANAVGMSGLDGTRRLAAALQVVRTQTGSAGEAATSVSNIFQKMTSDETVKRFRKMGIKDLRGDLERARKGGRDVLETFVELSRKATGGDLSKIPQLFQDAEFARGMRAMLSTGDQYQRLIAGLGNASGAVAKDLAKVSGDAESALTRLSNSFSNVMRSMGVAMEGGGVADGLNGIASRVDSVSTSFENLGKRMRESGIFGGLGQAFSDDNERAKNEPGAQTLFATTSFGAETARIQAQRKSLEEEYDFQRIQARRDQSKRRYEGGVAAGTSSPKSREIFLREQATADAAEADVRRQHIRDQAAISRQLAARAEKQFAYDRPDFRESRTKDDAVRGFYAGDKPVLGPAIPERAGPPAPKGAPVPPARPQEIAVQADATQVTSASQEVDALNAKIQATTGQTVTVTAQPQGMAGVIADLERIVALTARINASTIKTPSAGGGGNGSFSDTGVGG